MKFARLFALQFQPAYICYLYAEEEREDVEKKVGEALDENYVVLQEKEESRQKRAGDCFPLFSFPILSLFECYREIFFPY